MCSLQIKRVLILFTSVFKFLFVECFCFTIIQLKFRRRGICVPVRVTTFA